MTASDRGQRPGLAEAPCAGCRTAVTVYPPEDGDGPVTCGRCAGTALAVVHERVDDDLRQAVEDRLAQRIEGARARRERRAAFLAEKTRRRRRGLAERHRAKLSRSQDQGT